MIVSVIVPTMNTRPEGMAKLLESLKIATKEEIELLIEDGEDTVPVKVDRAFKKSKGKFIVYASDDCVFTKDSIDLAIIESVINDKGLVAFDTGVRNSEGYICEHFIIHRALAEELGEIFDTEFHHVSVDDLLWKRAKAKHQAMISRTKVIHNHFSRLGSGIEPDSMINRGWSHAEEDRQLLEKKLMEYGLK